MKREETDLMTTGSDLNKRGRIILVIFNLLDISPEAIDHITSMIPKKK